MLFTLDFGPPWFAIQSNLSLSKESFLFIRHVGDILLANCNEFKNKIPSPHLKFRVFPVFPNWIPCTDCFLFYKCEAHIVAIIFEKIPKMSAAEAEFESEKSRFQFPFNFIRNWSKFFSPIFRNSEGMYFKIFLPTQNILGYHTCMPYTAWI